ncbi:hypothetical protein [Liquorilactobacillus sicerae]|uniref:hypothetical protein n=1 Tax=Liquorilactobacillus sicerae TaxID=1416943 RepID=UPI00248187A7|nr:hypothetical protein [Liquorilactobacillus sicerae]
MFVEEYLIKGINLKVDRQQALEKMKVQVRHKASGALRSTAGDFLLPDIEIIYHFNQQQELQIDYVFSDCVPTEIREFWEKVIGLLADN